MKSCINIEDLEMSIKPNRSSSFDIYPEELLEPIEIMLLALPKISKLREHDIRKKVKPTEFLDRLRISFWMEYQKAFKDNRRMKLNKIYASICTKSYFKNNVVTDRYKLLWLITQPHSYNLEMRRIANNSLFEISQKLDESIRNKASKVDHTSIDEILKIVEWVHIHTQS